MRIVLLDPDELDGFGEVVVATTHPGKSFVQHLAAGRAEHAVTRSLRHPASGLTDLAAFLAATGRVPQFEHEARSLDALEEMRFGQLEVIGMPGFAEAGLRAPLDHETCHVISDWEFGCDLVFRQHDLFVRYACNLTN